MRHGSQIDPPNRFETVRREADLEQVEWDTEYLEDRLQRKISYLPDASCSIVSTNDSPDVPFRYSLNPYRGCVHACPYCYARPTHEYLGLNAGLDFETRILVKHDAPELFRKFLARPGWEPEPVVFSGVTDCYQPAEREFRLTRRCLEVAAECRLPVGIITKNALVIRDLPLLASLAERKLVHVNLSITTLDPELARLMEPRTSIPAARLRAVTELAAAGIPVRVMMAPIIPGLNDHEIPAVLRAAREAGASDARYILLRLPGAVEPVFREWLERTQPLRASRTEALVRSTRSGALNSGKFGERMTGSGEMADQIRKMFRVFREKMGFADLPPLDRTAFRPPVSDPEQLRLFPDL